MYTPDIEKGLFTRAKELLKSKTEEKVEDTITSLRDVLNWADYKYYVLSEPALADVEYDQLFKKLAALEEEYPEHRTADSPTQRVARGLSERFPQVPHLVPMLSLDNTYNADDLRTWDTRVRKSLGEGEEVEYCVEPKYDGASISLIYEEGKLARAATRGDGVVGEEITINVRQIRSIPLSARLDSVQTMEIRGEVVIHKETFAAYNKSRQEAGQSVLANPRNAASGTLRMLDPEEVRRRRLTAVLYHVAEADAAAGKQIPQEFSTHYDSLQHLQSLGFPTPANELRLFKTVDEVIAYLADFETRRDDLPFEVDGAVVKVNDLALQEKLGMTSHHPRWAVAYKFKARQATSILRRVEWSVNRTGTVAPIAKIDPVPIGGVTVTSVSLFNEDIIREKDLHYGDTVLVERAGDVIPYIVKPLAELRTGEEQPIVFPKDCPSCGSELEKAADDPMWRCINATCPAQAIERIIHFCSKDAMDIRGMGESNVKKFYGLGIVPDLPGLYKIDWERVLELERFGEKLVANLRDAVEKSKTQPLGRLVFGLGIRHVGETTGKVLANAVTHLKEFFTWTDEQFRALEDVGPVVAQSVAHFFHTEENQKLLEELESLGVNLANHHRGAAPVEGAFSGKTFLFTGTLSKLKRADAEAMVEAQGGTILGGVSSKLNYLVVGEDAGSKLEKAKKLGTVSVVSEDEFLEMVEAGA
jgi:DNA ligase (NAD+)